MYDGVLLFKSCCNAELVYTIFFIRWMIKCNIKKYMLMLSLMNYADDHSWESQQEGHREMISQGWTKISALLCYIFHVYWWSEFQQRRPLFYFRFGPVERFWCLDSTFGLGGCMVELMSLHCSWWYHQFIMPMYRNGYTTSILYYSTFAIKIWIAKAAIIWDRVSSS